MNRDLLLQLFNEQISGKNHAKGQRIIENDLVSSIDIENKEDIIYIKGKVISENLFNEYNTQIEFDVINESIESTYCTCMDFEKNEFKKENYCCKHLIATFYKAAADIAKLPIINKSNIKNKIINEKMVDVLEMLLNDGKHKDEIKIEAYVNRNQWDFEIYCEFKIGLSYMSSNNLYVLKDLDQFLLSMNNNLPIIYGKNFVLNFKEHRLSARNKFLMDFIQMLKRIEGSALSRNKKVKSFIDGKYLHIPDYLVREFFLSLKKHRIYLNEGFLSRCVETEVIEGAPPIEFDLKVVKSDYILKVPSGMPMVLGSRNNVFFHGTTIYVPNEDYSEKINPYLTVFNESKVVIFPNSKEDTILRELIPRLNYLSEQVELSKTIMDKIVIDDCTFKFYFDKEGKEITLITKVKYGAFEFNIFEDCEEKIIYRASKRENEVLGAIRALGFEAKNGKFYLVWGEDYIFRFFKSEVERLQKIGEVFYSERFKGIKGLNAKNIKGDIKVGKYDYFEIDFKLDNIPAKETSDILRAFRDNLKYYKLKSGEFLDLENLELKKFLKLLDVVSPKNISDNHIEIHKNKGIYVDEYLEENSIRYIKGKTGLKKIRNTIKNIGNLTFKIPQNLRGDLREYQRVGYNWFKTLDHLGFGGILGDEMGLGKTLQTITFLLSSIGSKSLIAVPTSLVYNWAQEFEKFAPNIKVAVVNGTKKTEKK